MEKCLNTFCGKGGPYIRGYCTTHYQRLRRGADPDAPATVFKGLHQVATRVNDRTWEILLKLAGVDGSIYDVTKNIIENYCDTQGVANGTDESNILLREGATEEAEGR